MHIFRATPMKTVITRPNQCGEGCKITTPGARLAAAGCVVLAIFSLSSLDSLRAGVEQVQRDFQARYHLVTGNYLQWPQCSAGQTPAPQFPKDGFYGDLTEDPDEGVMV